MSKNGNTKQLSKLKTKQKKKGLQNNYKMKKKRFQFQTKVRLCTEISKKMITMMAAAG
jgi:hypothetical protein